MNAKISSRTVYLMIGFAVLSLLAGFLGTIVTITGPDSWFALELIKPAWQPPNFLFAPVWTTLYILMGSAAGLVFAQGWEKKEVKIATVVFLIQLALNVLWSYMFFGWHLLLGSTIEIIVLWIMICVTMYLFYKVKPAAAYLLIPYILWVTFATVLTATIWMIN
ncbi:TspO and MBR like protein [Methanocorpusculum labreanum Z]|uniref:TspO and MBR like protein n=1 Tax=Methanocorpusculum labreanum (strain ATCC 43576 / DSM 4855 / Z) TaxID=410358 RepID=A2STM9_METLZ|nr:TspO/MBR family protein [Methanocorpusculum labreanum]ABN07685.1 TspO and MBR like protein [Methanocorpusculum labreanum Z]